MYFRRFELLDALRGRTAGQDPANADAAGHCVRQARDYFASADAASLLTRPVLLYYGMVSLAKVLLLLDPESPLGIAEIESIERQGHGMKQIDPPESPNGDWVLQECAIEVTADRKKNGPWLGRGVFPQLSRRLIPNGGGGWLGQQVPMLALFQAVPQLDLLMRETLGHENGFSGLWVTQVQRGEQFNLELPAADGIPLTRNEAQSRVSYLDREKYPVEEVDDARSPFRIRVSEDDFYALPEREELARHIHVLPPSLLGERMDGLLAQYMLMYGLSIVARYKPHRWGAILRGESTPLLPVLEQLMAVASRWWPNIVLNRLTNSVVLFAPHSYYS
jgi:hypothetical protein